MHRSPSFHVVRQLSGLDLRRRLRLLKSHHCPARPDGLRFANLVIRHHPVSNIREQRIDQPSKPLPRLGRQAINHTLERLTDRLRRRNVFERRLARPGLWSLRVRLWRQRRVRVAGEVASAHLGHLSHAQQAGHVLERLYVGVRHLVVGQRRKLHDHGHLLAGLAVEERHVVLHDRERRQILVGRLSDTLESARLRLAHDDLMNDRRLSPRIRPWSAAWHGLPFWFLNAQGAGQLHSLVRPRFASCCEGWARGVRLGC
jgi:hypothetical protein